MSTKITLTRRRMLALLAAAAAATPLHAQTSIFARRRKPVIATPNLVYIGTDTINSPAKGIYLSRFDSASGHLSDPVLAAETVRPSYMATARIAGKHLLYAANEGHDEATSTISTFLIHPADGALTLLGKVSAGGTGPCYISVDATGTCAFAASYTGSSVASFRVKPDGTLTEPVDRLDFRQKLYGHHGPNAARQDASHPHSALISPDDRFLIVNDLGTDNIVTFAIHPGTGPLLGAPRVNESRTPGSGPRHLAFHPNGRWVYGVNELTSTVQHYLWNATHGAGGVEAQALITEAEPAVSTLDAGYHGVNTAAEIAVSATGGSLIVSNRGENTLVLFLIDPTSGALTLGGRVACGGKTPRQFTLDGAGHFLLCGNQDSSNITVFRHDNGTGRLSDSIQTVAIDMPQMILFA